jgi:uncharacterized protein
MKVLVPQPHHSLMEGLLRSVTLACTRRPKTTLLITLVSVIACIVGTVYGLKFKTDRSDLIDPTTPFQQRWLRYTESFGESSDMVVVVEASRPESIKHALDVLGTKLKAFPDLFGNVLYKIEPGTLREKGLQYLPPAALAAGLDQLEDYRPILGGHWDLVRLENLIPLLRYQLRDLSEDNAPLATGLLEHSDRLASSLMRFAADRNDFPNPWPDLIPIDPQLRDQAHQTVYLLNEAGTMGFLMAAPVQQGDSFQGATAAIDRMRTLIAATQSEVPGVQIALTGIPVLENDEMRRSQIDSAWASVLSYSGVALLLFLGFRGFVHPLLGLLMLAVAMAWSFGYTTLAVGHLNILSVSFVAMLIGLGIDFAIHVLSRYLELRHQGLDLRHALVTTAEDIGPGIVTGAITTSLAFLCATLTEFLGVAELGVIAGGGILLCAVSAFTVLPALVAFSDRRRETRSLPRPFEGKWLRNATQQRPRLVFTGCMMVMLAVAWIGCDWSQGWPKPLVAYDHNLLHLQAKGLESVEAQNRIFEGSKNSVLYAISLAETAEDARARKAAFEKLPTVRHVEELATRLPDSPASETGLFVQAFHASLNRLPSQLPPPSPVSPGEVGRLLDELYRDLLARPEPQAQRVARTLDLFLAQLDSWEIRDQVAFLTEFQYRLSYSLLAQFQALYAASNPETVSVEDLPPELRARYVSPQGQWLLQVFPKDQVWDMEPLERFVQEVRSVDPDVTGTPLQNFEAALQIKQSYEICALYALIVMVVVLLLDFVRTELLAKLFVPPMVATGLLAAVCAWAEQPLPFMWMAVTYAAGTLVLAAWFDRNAAVDTVLALMPPLLGVLLTFGLMPLFNIPLNPANLIILPLILGIGVDNGVHVLHDYRSRPKEIFSPAPSIVNAILLTSTTTMVGFGSMMIAAHQGLYSLGAVLTLGVGSTLFVSLLMLPSFLSWVSARRLRRNQNDLVAAETQRRWPPLDDSTSADSQALPLPPTDAPAHISQLAGPSSHGSQASEARLRHRRLHSPGWGDQDASHDPSTPLEQSTAATAFLDDPPVGDAAAVLPLKTDTSKPGSPPASEPLWSKSDRQGQPLRWKR